MLSQTMRRMLIPFALSCMLGIAPVLSQRQYQQPPRTPARVPVTVALVDRLPVPNAPFVILRRTDLTPADVILLPRSADPRLFTDAVRALLLARRNVGGDVPAAGAVLRARFRETGGSVRPLLPWTPRVLNDLRHAAVVEIPGVGAVRAVQIWLPRQQGHD